VQSKQVVKNGFQSMKNERKVTAEQIDVKVLSNNYKISTVSPET